MSPTTPTPATRRSRPAPAALLAAGLATLLAVTLAPAPPARATPGAPAAATRAGVADQAAPAAEEPDTTIATISPDLAMVAVDSKAYRAATTTLRATQASLDEVRASRATAEAELANLSLQDAQLTGQIAKDTSVRKLALVHLAAIRDAVRAIAVTSYVQGNQPPADPADLDAANAVASRAITLASVSDGQRAKEDDAASQLAHATAQLATDVAARAQVRDRTATLSAARDSAAAQEAGLTAAVAQQQVDVEQARARADVRNGDGMTLLALDAYWKAAQELATSKPRCHIEWWALAGIGRVEGHHGTFGGAHLLGNGNTSAPIIGIVLDGTNNTAVIPDSDNGTFDGDPDHDHAVGPMQFIPSTWRRWQADGNGDGTNDPSNMYDAVLAAGRYLCASGPMVTDEDLTRGYFSYNHSDDYAAAVLGDALYYRDNVAIPPVPPPDVVAAAATPAIPAG